MERPGHPDRGFNHGPVSIAFPHLIFGNIDHPAIIEPIGYASSHALALADLADEGFRTLTSAIMDQTIKIAVPADLAETWLPPLLATFMAAHPGISTETFVLRNSEIIEKIEHGEVDIALQWVRNENGDTVEKVATFPIEWMAARSFTSALHRALPMVVLQSPCLFRDLGFNELEKADEPTRITMATTGVTGLWSAVSAGLGVTCRVPIAVPEGVIRYKDARLPELGTIDLALRTAEGTIQSIQMLKGYLANAV